MKSAWPEMIKKGMTPAARRKMHLENIFREREIKQNRVLLAAERKRAKEARGNAAAEVRRQLMAANPGKRVVIAWNKTGTMQARVGGKFVKI